MSGVITYEDGKTSYLSTEVKHDEQGNVKEYISQIDGKTGSMVKMYTGFKAVSV